MDNSLQNHSPAKFRGGQKSPLMLQAAIFIFIVSCTFVFLNTWHIWNAYYRNIQEAESNSANLARALSQHAEDTFLQVDVTLLDLLERINTDGMSPARLPRLQAVMSGQVANLAQMHGGFIYDAQGHWLVTAAGIIPSNANNSDREYFIYHKTNDNHDVHIGEVIRSRSTGDLVIPVSRRINNPDGSFGGVVLVTIKISYFQSFYNNFSLEKQAALVLMLTDGTILYRHPFEESAIGRDMSKSPLFTDLLHRARFGNVTLVSIYDKVVRVYGYSRVEHYPLVIAAGLSKHEALNGWRSDSTGFAVGGGVILIILIALAWLLIREITSSVRTGNELINTRDMLTQANQTLEVLALLDGLTGLANRRQFDIVLKNEMERAVRNDAPLGIIMMDIDFFKKFNDIYGHVAGDECLQRVGQTLMDVPHRSHDLIARYGGEEFAIILPGTDRDAALVFAERIIQAIRELQIPHDANPFGIVTISAGIHCAVPKMPEQTPAGFVRIADSALYEAKSLGRNRVCYA